MPRLTPLPRNPFASTLAPTASPVLPTHACPPGVRGSVAGSSARGRLLPSTQGRRSVLDTERRVFREEAMAQHQAAGIYSIRVLFAAIALVLSALCIIPAQAQEPIKIGFSVSLTGGLASSGKAHLLSKQIWLDEINAKGGLLGRPVKLVYYDDQTNAAIVPGIYAKLIDVDKVDILMGAATNLIVAAMPLIAERKKLVMVLVALGSNAEFKYPRFFQSAPFGPDPKGVLSNAFFEVAKSIKPAPKTVALVGADAEFSNNVLTGARENAKKFSLQIVFDRSYPPNTVDFSPIVRAIQASNADVVMLASYPPDSVGMVRAAAEIGLKTQLFGGAMVGMQYASLISQLGEKLNRVVNYHFYVPSATMTFPGIDEFLKKYQSQAKDAGVDPLGFYQPPFAYAAMQVLEQAAKATGSLNEEKLAEYIHKTAFNTIVGEIKFNELGEWAAARPIMVQFQNVQGTGLEQFLTGHKQVIVYPDAYKDGELEYPLSK
jgi:branched-chain amino acid transport system substrate-binding protein